MRADPKMQSTQPFPDPSINPTHRPKSVLDGNPASGVLRDMAIFLHGKLAQKDPQPSDSRRRHSTSQALKDIFADIEVIWATLQDLSTKNSVDPMQLMLETAPPKLSNRQMLFRASEHGHEKVVRLIAPLANPKSTLERSLRIAAQRGHTGIVAILAPLSNVLDHDEESLVSAVTIGRLKMLRLLLDQIDRARSQGLLTDYEPSPDPLLAAANLGRDKQIDMLLPGREHHADLAARAAALGSNPATALRLLPHMSDPAAVADVALGAATLDAMTELKAILDQSGPDFPAVLRAQMDVYPRKDRLRPQAFAFIQAYLDERALREDPGSILQSLPRTAM